MITDMRGEVRGEAFQNFIAYTLNRMINIKFAWKHFCKEYRNQRFTWSRLWWDYYYKSNCLNTFNKQYCPL